MESPRKTMLSPFLSGTGWLSEPARTMAKAVVTSKVQARIVRVKVGRIEEALFEECCNAIRIDYESAALFASCSVRRVVGRGKLCRSAKPCQLPACGVEDCRREVRSCFNSLAGKIRKITKCNRSGGG